jgi:hypothetical protein
MILMIAATLTLGVLLFRVRWEGGGRFEVTMKDHLGLDGSLVDARPATTTQAKTKGPKKSSSKPLAGARRCQELRATLAKSVVAYLKKTRLPMNRLDIFALLEADVLHDIPTCPRGGTFSQTKKGKIRCSLHGS